MHNTQYLEYAYVPLPSLRLCILRFPCYPSNADTCAQYFRTQKCFMRTVVDQDKSEDIIEGLKIELKNKKYGCKDTARTFCYTVDPDNVKL